MFKELKIALVNVVVAWFILAGFWRCTFDLEHPIPYPVVVYQFGSSSDDRVGLELTSFVLGLDEPIREKGFIFDDVIFTEDSMVPGRISIGKVRSEGKEFFLFDYFKLGDTWLYGGSDSFRLFQRQE